MAGRLGIAEAGEAATGHVPQHQSESTQGGMKLQNRAFQLIFGPMQGNAHLRSPLRRRRAAASAVSAVLVLAFALFPVLAQASDSAGAQYQDRLPTATGPGGGKNGGGRGGSDHNGSSGNQGSSHSGSGGGSSVGGGGGGGSSPPSGPSGSPGSQGGNGSPSSNPGSGGQSSGGSGTSTLYQGRNASDVQFRTAMTAGPPRWPGSWSVSGSARSSRSSSSS